MLVLDTHIFLWFVQDNPNLSVLQRNAIEHAISDNQEILLSSISIWEICMLSVKGRLILNSDIDSFIQNIQVISWLSFAPINNTIAIESTRLPGNFHKDPADRMIVALTRTQGATLVTSDEKILNYKYVNTL